MLRRSVCCLWAYSDHRGHYGPPVHMPPDYVSRVTNPKQLVLTHPHDPKYTWNTQMDELAALHPGFFGKGLKRPTLNYDTRSGVHCELPPVPVYREHIWCMGHYHFYLQHPRIFIKCPRNTVVICKWCRTKFINLATDDDNDDDWREEEYKIAVTPESKEDLLEPIRDYGGVIRQNRFQDGKAPDPFAHRSVFDPERFRVHLKDQRTYEVHPAYATKPHDDASSKHGH